jgi:hypothetical protein
VLPVSDPLRGQNARGSIDEVIDLDEVTPQQNPLLTDVIERKLHPLKNSGCSPGSLPSTTRATSHPPRQPSIP